MQVPLLHDPAERTIEWLLSKSGKDQMMKMNLIALPMTGSKAFGRLAATWRIDRVAGWSVAKVWQASHVACNGRPSSGAQCMQRKDLSCVIMRQKPQRVSL